MASERRRASDRPRVLLSLENISSDPNIAVFLGEKKEKMKMMGGKTKNNSNQENQSLREKGEFQKKPKGKKNETDNRESLNVIEMTPKECTVQK